MTIMRNVLKDWLIFSMVISKNHINMMIINFVIDLDNKIHQRALLFIVAVKFLQHASWDLFADNEN